MFKELKEDMNICLHENHESTNEQLNKTTFKIQDVTNEI